MRKFLHQWRTGFWLCIIAILHREDAVALKVKSVAFKGNHKIQTEETSIAKNQGKTTFSDISPQRYSSFSAICKILQKKLVNYNFHLLMDYPEKLIEQF